MHHYNSIVKKYKTVIKLFYSGTDLMIISAVLLIVLISYLVGFLRIITILKFYSRKYRNIVNNYSIKLPWYLYNDNYYRPANCFDFVILNVIFKYH